MVVTAAAMGTAATAEVMAADMADTTAVVMADMEDTTVAVTVDMVDMAAATVTAGTFITVAGGGGTASARAGE